MNHIRKVSTLVVVGVALFALIASGETESSSGSAGDAKSSSAGESSEVDDVTVAGCAKDDVLGFPEATLSIVNNSEKPSDYIIEVSFESPDGAMNNGTGNALVQRLAPGQTKTEEVTAFEDSAGANPVTCKVTKVSRNASL